MHRTTPQQPPYMVELVDCPNENYHFLYIHAQIAANTLEEVVALKQDAHKIMQCEEVWVWQRVEITPASCEHAKDDGVVYEVPEASNDGHETGLPDDIGRSATHKSDVRSGLDDSPHRKDDPVAE